MIEDKKDGIKIAENPTEALWETVRKAAAERIKSMNDGLIVEKALLELAEKKKLDAIK